ncbi:MAG TPA: hypothetical protein VGD71_31395 [Kribbella sp.]
MATSSWRKLKTLQSRIGNDDMGGTMILTFEQNFVTPLPAVIHGQYAVAVLAAATLLAEQRIWVKVRDDVLGIADKMHAAMKDRGSGTVFDLGTITAFIDLLGMLPTPGKPILNKVGDALGPLATLLGIKDSPSKPEVEFAGDMPDDVIGNTKSALKKLAETIKGRERVIDRQIKDAMRTITSRGGSFDLPTPEVLKEKQIHGMAVNLDTLNFLAMKTMPIIESQLNQATDLLNSGSQAVSAWYRPPELNTWDTGYGPYDTWSALLNLAEGLVGDLAWEVREAANHLALASDQIGGPRARSRHPWPHTPRRSPGQAAATNPSTTPRTGSSRASDGQDLDRPVDPAVGDHAARPCCVRCGHGRVVGAATICCRRAHVRERAGGPVNRETPKSARPKLLVALAVLAVVLAALLISWDEEPGPPEPQPELGPLSLSKRVWAADGVTLFRNGGTVRLRDGRLLVATGDGIKLLDVESGAALWAQDNDAELPGRTVGMDPTASQQLPFVVRHGDGVGVLVGYDVVRCDLVEPGVALLSGGTGDVVWQAPTTPAEGCAQNKVDWKQNLWAADDTTALVSVAPDGGNPDDLGQVRVLALDVATGQRKWEYQGAWPQAIADGVALVSTVKPIPPRVTGSGMVTALDLATGQPKWSVADRYAEAHLVQSHR